LVDNKALGRRFRDSYVRGVRRLIKAGRLEIDDAAQLKTILAEVAACDFSTSAGSLVSLGGG
jgi:hypothetical protein